MVFESPSLTNVIALQVNPRSCSLGAVTAAGEYRCASKRPVVIGHRTSTRNSRQGVELSFSVIQSGVHRVEILNSATFSVTVEPAVNLTIPMHMKVTIIKNRARLVLTTVSRVL